MINKYKRYCSTCHFTLYIGEQAREVEGKVSHLNCQEALNNKEIARNFNPRTANLMGRVNKKKLRKMLDEYAAAQPQPATGFAGAGG